MVYFSYVLQGPVSYKCYEWHKSRAKCNVKKEYYLRSSVLLSLSMYFCYAHIV